MNEEDGQSFDALMLEFDAISERISGGTGTDGDCDRMRVIGDALDRIFGCDPTSVDNDTLDQAIDWPADILF